MAEPIPTTEDLTRLAAEQQRLFDAFTSPEERRQRGHFGTPPAIANFMASMFDGFSQENVRVLDPGAGVGTLSAAVCNRILQQPIRRDVVFELWENDPKLGSYLRRTMECCRSALHRAGHEMAFTIRSEDFVLENAQRSLFEAGPVASFEFAIMNPPYYKLRKNSKCAQAMKHVVHGQPNIYALFMAVAADLLIPGGELVAITPRSYFNGPYFKRFRKWFFDRAAAKRIHVFESRADAFRNDDVLQENVILLAEKSGAPSNVVVTSSIGQGLSGVGRRIVPYRKVVEDSSGDHLVRVATSGIELNIIEAMDRLPRRFREIGIEISTGPVVTF
ncbi:MAG TPA: Eco57I restriction-modification methylase domain-containing protein, partial [Pirellulales bacterium]|nr:Eco57I restriction-modification methylase domain-containing protein [Pirellulales bacterium]